MPLRVLGSRPLAVSNTTDNVATGPEVPPLGCLKVEVIGFFLAVDLMLQGERSSAHASSRQPDHPLEQRAGARAFSWR